MPKQTRPFYKRAALLSILWVIFSRPALADCANPDSPKAVIDCTLINDPEVLREQAAASQGRYLEDQAGQRPNPELGSRAVFGSLLGENQSTIEVNLAHTMELGGKRDARIEKARAEKEGILATLQRAKEEVFIETLRGLYRLRQVRAEISILDEALGTFSEIQKHYRSRLKLSPEQEVSSHVIGLAESDYRLRRTALETEENSLLRSISLSIGQPFTPTAAALPEPKTHWPKLNESAPKSQERGSPLRLALSEVRLATADLSQAQSLSWPDLKVGPSFENQTQGASQYQNWGANLTFSIPLFHANGGGRAYASQGVLRAEESLNLRRKEIDQRRAILLDQYERAVQAIEQSTPQAEIKRKHQGMDKLFTRGLLPSSLVIEAHRQIFDFTRSQNELELSAISALWRIHALDGRIFEEAL